MRYLYLLAVLILVSCSSENEKNNKSPETKIVSRFDYPDVLDLHGFPENKQADSLQLFFDLGSWYGFSLPGLNDTAHFGAFAGPFLLDQYKSRWLMKFPVKISLCNHSSPQRCNYSNVKIISFPGILSQEFTNDNFSVKLDLIYVSPSTSLLRTIVKNNSDLSGSFSLSLESEFFPNDQIEVSTRDNELIYKKDKDIISIIPGKSYNLKTFKNEKYFTGVSSELVTLNSHESYKSFSYISVYNENDSIDKSFLKEVPEWLMDKNNKRWNRYLENIFDAISQPDEQYCKIAVKCLQTLVSNWRVARGALKHEGLFPSYSYTGFHGFWAWDSWKHAVALAIFEPGVAKNQVRAMFDYQDSSGMIVDCVFPDTLQEKINRRNTKPPLSAWSVWKIYERTGDKEFLLEMFPKLLKYHKWWYQYRDHDKNGICEFGSCDGSRIAAAWESGMDNAVRFDSAQIVKNENGGYSLDQESVDLNTFLWIEKKFLRKIAIVTGITVPELLADEGNKIRNTFYDQTMGYFFDYNPQKKNHVKIFGPEGWLPLWARLALPQQAEKVKEIMMSEKHFMTYFPLPTLSVSHKMFDPFNGYWRGPVWIDQVYFGIAGLKNYGFVNEANKIKKLVFENLEKQKNKPLYENYHPANGEGLNARNFSWTAAHLLMILWEE